MPVYSYYSTGKILIIPDIIIPGGNKNRVKV